ncbi:unnamed protein product [Larinioides sclopetarius]|uniref:Uncharacterized protein n=1 Tax=Larinioides sclopetarius TaxID=280406 RepID=A0AAV1Z0M9_9ARAC
MEDKIILQAPTTSPDVLIPVNDILEQTYQLQISEDKIRIEDESLAKILSPAPLNRSASEKNGCWSSFRQMAFSLLLCGTMICTIFAVFALNKLFPDKAIIQIVAAIGVLAFVVIFLVMFYKTEKS